MRGRPPRPAPIPATPSWLCPPSRGRPSRVPNAPLRRGQPGRLQDGSDQDDTPLGNKVGRPKSRTPAEEIRGEVEKMSRFIDETQDVLAKVIPWIGIQMCESSLLGFPQLLGGGASGVGVYRLSLPPRHNVEHPCGYREISNTGCEIDQMAWVD
jgi:hypothetical protein